MATGLYETSVDETSSSSLNPPVKYRPAKKRRRKRCPNEQTRARPGLSLSLLSFHFLSLLPHLPVPEPRPPGQFLAESRRQLRSDSRG
ncbi:hypothetical protein LY76DRAFT_593006 [Colletotrichum caudatum]|nr:hypothetical protein LY76DRAFT_593006 [Colletotrichum caudatum]